ncbi:MAG: hypothetical protein ACLQNE_12395 [Thermoguttaceae bacterium]
MHYNPNAFADLNADNLRTYGLGITFAQQADVLLADAVKAGQAKIVTDALRPYEFDRERAVDFGIVAANQKLAELRLTADADGVYYLRLHTAPEAGIADLSLESGGKRLPIVTKRKPCALELGGLVLTKGEHSIGLVAATSGHAIFNCLQLEPAPRFSQAIEAEELSVERATGGATEPRPSDPIPGVSAGRVLEFHAGRAGQGFVLNLGKRPALPYTLGVRPMVSPKAAILQAFVAGKPIGPKFDLYAAQRRLGPSVLPLGPVPAGVSAVEIRAVGSNELSQGHDIELDYIQWEPKILGPGTAEGVWAHVIGTHDCEYRPQDLGPAYSDGHQFWVQPSNLNAWVDIAIEIPQAASYEFVVKYTKSWDYARVQAFLDGKPFGPIVDTYAPTVVPADPLTLGKLDLPAGRHVLRFQAVGHDPQSKGYLMGIDHVIVK